MSVKVGDQLIVREVPQAGAVIRHAVGIAWEVERPLLIAKHALMHLLESQQIGGQPSAGRRPFGGPPVRGSIVCARGGRRFREVSDSGEDVVVGNVTS